MQKMTFEELDGNDLERMKVNAMNVPVEWMVHQLNELMKSQTSLPKPELFCYNEEYWKTLQLLLKNFNSRL